MVGLPVSLNKLNQLVPRALVSEWTDRGVSTVRTILCHCTPKQDWFVRRLPEIEEDLYHQIRMKKPLEKALTYEQHFAYALRAAQEPVVQAFLKKKPWHHFGSIRLERLTPEEHHAFLDVLHHFREAKKTDQRHLYQLIVAYAEQFEAMALR